MRLGGNIVAFEVKGGITGGQSFLNAIKMCSLSDNLGKSGTIATHPSSITHAKVVAEVKATVGIIYVVLYPTYILYYYRFGCGFK